MTDTNALAATPSADTTDRPQLLRAGVIVQPAAPPQYLSKSDIAAITDPGVLNAALMEGRVHWHIKDIALERQAALLMASPAGVTPVQPSTVDRTADLPDSSALPATADEAAQMAALEREAFTTAPALASDYTIPGEHPSQSEDIRETNHAIRHSLFAAQIPVPVANAVLAAATRIAQQLETLSPEDAAKFSDTRSALVRDHLKGKWGDQLEPRIQAVKAYLKGAAEKADAAGHPTLKEILTNNSELLDDPGAIEMLWQAARFAGN